MMSLHKTKKFITKDKKINKSCADRDRTLQIIEVMPMCRRMKESNENDPLADTNRTFVIAQRESFVNRPSLVR